MRVDNEIQISEADWTIAPNHGATRSGLVHCPVGRSDLNYCPPLIDVETSDCHLPPAMIFQSLYTEGSRVCLLVEIMCLTMNRLRLVSFACFGACFGMVVALWRCTSWNLGSANSSLCSFNDVLDQIKLKKRFWSTRSLTMSEGLTRNQQRMALYYKRRIYAVCTLSTTTHWQQIRQTTLVRPHTKSQTQQTCQAAQRRHHRDRGRRRGQCQHEGGFAAPALESLGRGAAGDA